MNVKRWMVWLVMVAAAWTLQAGAQAAQKDQTRAARLSYVSGKVTVEGLDGELTGTVNMPVVEGQRVETGDDGKAEIEFEDGTTVRLVPASAAVLNVMSLDGGQSLHTEVGLLNGQFYLTLNSNGNTFLADALGEHITPMQSATVRVQVDQPPATVSVMSGQVQVARDGGFSVPVHGGESLTGDQNNTSRYLLADNVQQDSWDQWNQERENSIAQQAAVQSDAQTGVNPQAGYGSSELDANGDWYDLPGQGKVWQPTVAMDASFDPYGYGSWVYYPSAGYVWVSGYSWGWTPFRCGYWNYYNSFGWGWMPTGCSVWGGGWGGYGGVYLRIGRGPSGYRPPVRPAPGRGGAGWMPPHRIIPINGGAAPRRFQVAGNPGGANGSRNFNGRPVSPIARRTVPVQRGGTVFTTKGRGPDAVVERSPATANWNTQPIVPTGAMTGNGNSSGWRSVNGAGTSGTSVKRPASGTTGSPTNSGQPGNTQRPGQQPGQRPVWRPMPGQNGQPQGGGQQMQRPAPPSQQQPSRPTQQMQQRPAPYVAPPNVQRTAPVRAPAMQRPAPAMQRPAPMMPQAPRMSAPASAARPSAPAPAAHK